MNRREALRSISVLLGGALVGSSRFLNGQANADSASFARGFSEGDIALLDGVGETILPATEDSQGAKAAEIGRFMREVVSEIYSDEEREIFFAGISELNAFSRDRAGRDFMELYPDERYELLLELEKQENVRYYRMMKELTLWGYFSSEIGCKQAQNHLPIPGRWEPCVEVGPEAKAWS